MYIDLGKQLDHQPLVIFTKILPGLHPALKATDDVRRTKRNIFREIVEEDAPNLEPKRVKRDSFDLLEGPRGGCCGGVLGLPI